VPGGPSGRCGRGRARAGPARLPSSAGDRVVEFDAARMAATALEAAAPRSTPPAPSTPSASPTSVASTVVADRATGEPVRPACAGWAGI